MNPASMSPLPAVLDPVVAAIMEQLKEQVEAKRQVIAEKDQAISAKDQAIAKRDQALFAAEAIIEQLKEALRLERIRKYGKQSEKLSDLQLELLAGEPGVSSEEVAGEVERGPLPDASASTLPDNTPAATPSSTRHKHPGRNELPSHLERVEKIIGRGACAHRAEIDLRR